MLEDAMNDLHILARRFARVIPSGTEVFVLGSMRLGHSKTLIVNDLHWLQIDDRIQAAGADHCSARSRGFSVALAWFAATRFGSSHLRRARGRPADVRPSSPTPVQLRTVVSERLYAEAVKEALRSDN